MSNKMLDNILVIKVNGPELAKVIDKIENVIVERALRKYFSSRKWRWSAKNKSDTTPLKTMDIQEWEDDFSNEEWESDDKDNLGKHINEQQNSD